MTLAMMRDFPFWVGVTYVLYVYQNDRRYASTFSTSPTNVTETKFNTDILVLFTLHSQVYALHSIGFVCFVIEKTKQNALCGFEKEFEIISYKHNVEQQKGCERFFVVEFL
jgi:hypothetical protein